MVLHTKTLPSHLTAFPLHYIPVKRTYKKKTQSVIIPIVFTIASFSTHRPLYVKLRQLHFSQLHVMHSNFQFILCQNGTKSIQALINYDLRHYSIFGKHILIIITLLISYVINMTALWCNGYGARLRSKGFHVRVSHGARFFFVNYFFFKLNIE